MRMKSVAEALLEAPKTRTLRPTVQAARKAGPIIRMIIAAVILARRKSVMGAVITVFFG